MFDPREGIGADGMIVTGAARSRVPPKFEPVLRACIADCSMHEAPVSVYVYGSVATGTARVGTSDVDILTLGLPQPHAAALRKVLSERFHSLSRGVEIAVAQPQDFTGGGDQTYGNCVFLKHYCVHLAGPDRQVPLGPFPADARAACGFNGDIAQHYRAWVRALGDGHDIGGADHAVLGRRVARKTLLAVAGLVSVQDAMWTTDRATTARRWSQVRPAQAFGLADLMSWSESSSSASADALSEVLAVGGIVERVVEDFRAVVGLWR